MKNITIDYNLEDLNIFTPVLRGWSSHLFMVSSIATAIISLVIQIAVYRSLKRLGPRHINQMIIPNQVKNVTFNSFMGSFLQFSKILFIFIYLLDQK